MQALLIRDISEIDITETEWNRTVSMSTTNTIFQTYQWFHAWWKVFGGHHKLFFISVYDKDRLVGFSPLMISAHKINGNVLRFVGYDKSDYSDFILIDKKEETLCKIFETIANYKKEWDSIILNNVPENSSTSESIKKICEYHKFKTIYDNSTICPALLIKGHEQFAARISNKYSLRRRCNYFQKNGRIRFYNVQSEEEAKKYLPLFFEQHIKRWSMTKFPSLFINHRNRAFYEELMSAIIHRGWLLFSVVEFNEQPIAFHYGFHYNSKLIWYKPSFDISYASHSPGKVLLQHLIKYLIESGLHELDFTIGDDPFKRHFTNINRKNIRMAIYRSSGKSLMYYARHYAKCVIVKMLGVQK